MQNDPYKTPESDIQVQAIMKRSIAWKIYFFFILFLSLISYLGIFTIPEAGLTEYISVLFWITGTIGLFGFVFLKRILNPGFWLNFLVVYIIFSVAYYFLTSINLSEGMTDNEYLITNIIGWIISLPGYIALYLYSRASNIPWTQTDG
ncbi:MAG: hypothetical protein OEZ38_10750 [Gammaproteobacteria bacterium]|nr:hypothetical protein [Gammaproteobacteria bacterium]